MKATLTKKEQQRLCAAIEVIRKQSALAYLLAGLRMLIAEGQFGDPSTAATFAQKCWNETTTWKQNLTREETKILKTLNEAAQLAVNGRRLD